MTTGVQATPVARSTQNSDVVLTTRGVAIDELPARFAGAQKEPQSIEIQPSFVVVSTSMFVYTAP